MKYLVCGSRNYTQVTFLRRFLTAIHRQDPITCIVHGDAGKVCEDTGDVLWGADKLAGEWAEINSIPVKKYPANWERFGKRAGPMRNFKMLECDKPDYVIAFPGNEGTMDMIEQALTYGVPVIDALTKKVIYPITKVPPSTLPGM